MLKVPPRRKLGKLLKKQVTLTKFSLSSNEDAYGQKERTVAGTYSIEAEIQEITAEDLSFLVPGVASIGDAWGYFLPSYLVSGQNITISPEDEVTWNGKTWRIDKIEDYYYGENLFYKRALMKRVI